jgi:hypothetical protein
VTSAILKPLVNTKIVKKKKSLKQLGSTRGADPIPGPKKNTRDTLEPKVGARHMNSSKHFTGFNQPVQVPKSKMDPAQVNTQFQTQASTAKRVVPPQTPKKKQASALLKKGSHQGKTDIDTAETRSQRGSSDSFAGFDQPVSTFREGRPIDPLHPQSLSSGTIKQIPIPTSLPGTKVKGRPGKKAEHTEPTFTSSPIPFPTPKGSSNGSKSRDQKKPEIAATRKENTGASSKRGSFETFTGFDETTVAVKTKSSLVESADSHTLAKKPIGEQRKPQYSTQSSDRCSSDAESLSNVNPQRAKRGSVKKIAKKSKLSECTSIDISAPPVVEKEIKQSVEFKCAVPPSSSTKKGSVKGGRNSGRGSKKEKKKVNAKEQTYSAKETTERVPKTRRGSAKSKEDSERVTTASSVPTRGLRKEKKEDETKVFWASESPKATPETERRKSAQFDESAFADIAAGLDARADNENEKCTLQ